MTRPSSSTARRRAIDDAKPPSANYHAQALARGLMLLEMLAEKPEPLTLGDLSERADLPKSTLVRLLAVMAEMGYVVRVDDRPSYRLGHKVQKLASAYVARLDLRTVAGQYLAPLAQRTGQTANLGLLDGGEVLHAAVERPDRPIVYAVSAGWRDHPHSTGLGKMLLSALTSEELHARLPAEPFKRFTEATITTFEELEQVLRRTARRGYATDQGEGHAGLACVAVPLPVNGEWIAAISVSGPSGEFGPTRRNEYVADLQATAEAMIANPDVTAAVLAVHGSLRAGHGSLNE